MKFLFVANTMWNVYNFRLHLMKYLKEMGNDVKALAPYDDFNEKLKNEGIDCINLKIDRKGINPLKDLYLSYKLYRIYKKLKPDIVFHYTIKPNIYGTIASYFAKVKSINTISGLGYVFVRKNLFQYFVKILYKISLTFSNKVIFQNDADYNLFVNSNIVPHYKSEVIKGSGVDTDFFSPNFCKKNKQTSKFSFALIARLLWDKGVGEFVEAAKIIRQKYKDTEFYLVGSIDKGNPASISFYQINKWEKEGIIKYKKFIADIRKFLCRCDVVVLPSYREGIPRVLLEASAMKKPIITTDVPGCRDVVEDNKTGLLIPPRDVNALAVAMEKMLNMSAKERSLMGKRGREKVIKEFSSDIVIKKYVKIIEEILKQE